MSLIMIDAYERTADLFVAVKSKFAQGAEMVSLTEEDRVVGFMLSTEMAKEILARRTAERLVADPSALAELEKRLQERPELWE